MKIGGILFLKANRNAHTERGAKTREYWELFTIIALCIYVALVSAGSRDGSIIKSEFDYCWLHCGGQNLWSETGDASDFLHTGEKTEVHK